MGAASKFPSFSNCGRRAEPVLLDFINNADSWHGCSVQVPEFLELPQKSGTRASGFHRQLRLVAWVQRPSSRVFSNCGRRAEPVLLVFITTQTRGMGAASKFPSFSNCRRRAELVLLDFINNADSWHGCSVQVPEFLELWKKSGTRASGFHKQRRLVAWVQRPSSRVFSNCGRRAEPVRMRIRALRCSTGSASQWQAMAVWPWRFSHATNK
jgi:hypothetical protein